MQDGDELFTSGLRNPSRSLMCEYEPVFSSQSTGAGVYVFSNDHCPPHVHAQHRGDRWTARVRFSFIGSTVELLTIAPLRNPPLRRTVNQLLDDIAAELPACRRSWWAARETTCLANQWALVPTPGTIGLLPRRRADAKQIAEATYDPDQEQLRVTFQDGTTADVSARQ
jgi:hypothetical protein